MNKADKILFPFTLILALLILVLGIGSVRSIVNKPAEKPTDLNLPKVSGEALESVRSRASTGRFESSLEVTNTRDNPFSTFSGYVAPTTPPVETSATETGTATTTNATSQSSTSTTNGTTTTTGTTTSSTSPATESEGDKQLPTLPPEVKAVGL